MIHRRPDDEAWYCGQCGFEGKSVAIVYGYPSSEASDAAVAGEIVLGGCVVTGDDPEIACSNCRAALDDYPQLPPVRPVDRLAGGVWGHLVGDESAFRMSSGRRLTQPKSDLAPKELTTSRLGHGATTAH